MMTSLTTQTLAGFLITRNWRDTPQGIRLELWFSTDQGPLRAVIEGQRSVFFLSESEVERAAHILQGRRGMEVGEVNLQDFALRPVRALYFSSYKEARRCAEQLAEAGFDPLEADINPAERFLMERFIQGSAEIRGDVRKTSRHIEMTNPAVKSGYYRPSLSVASIDIETAMSGLQLYSIGVHARRGNDEFRHVFMLGEGIAADYVSCFGSQGELLQAFTDWLADYDPDVLIGWNVINFDAWYLQRVARQLGVSLVFGRGAQRVHWRDVDEEGERHAIQIPGRVLLDGIELLRAAFYNFESFSLENVANELLGEGKLLKGTGRGEEITELFHEDKLRLAEYNLKDCELVSDIFEHTGLLEFAVARSAMTGLNLDRMGGSVASFDNLYLPRLHRAGYVAPNASKQLIASPGGFVLDSLPGIYDHVLVLDFKSLYPSIIRTFCIDPLGLALGASGTLDDSATVAGFLEATFAREGHILPDLIERLWRERDEAKAGGDNALSQAIKIIMNSFYGVLGTNGCRFFDARLATSITRRGHEILQLTRDYIEEAGFRVIYGDTDSVFVWVPEAETEADAMRAGKTLEQDLNLWWQRRISEQFNLDCALELEFETHYRRFLMPTVRGSDKGSKKRYAGVVTRGEGEELVFKGLENVRTDWTRLARNFQEELYRRVFYGEPYEQYVKAVASQVRAGQRDDELVYRKRLRKPLVEYERNIPPHVKAALLYEDRGLPAPGRGRAVDYVITQAGAEPATAFRSPLDYEHYIESQLQPVADGILCFLDTSFQRIVEKQIDLF